VRYTLFVLTLPVVVAVCSLPLFTGAVIVYVAALLLFVRCDCCVAVVRYALFVCGTTCCCLLLLYSFVCLRLIIAVRWCSLVSLRLPLFVVDYVTRCAVTLLLGGWCYVCSVLRRCRCCCLFVVVDFVVCRCVFVVTFPFCSLPLPIVVCLFVVTDFGVCCLITVVVVVALCCCCLRYRCCSLLIALLRCCCCCCCCCCYVVVVTTLLPLITFVLVVVVYGIVTLLFVVPRCCSFCCCCCYLVVVVPVYCLVVVRCRAPLLLLFCLLLFPPLLLLMVWCVVPFVPFVVHLFVGRCCYVVPHY